MTNTHDAWRNTNSRSRNEFAKDGKTEAFSDRTAHKQNRQILVMRFLRTEKSISNRQEWEDQMMYRGRRCYRYWPSSRLQCVLFFCRNLSFLVFCSAGARQVATGMNISEQTGGKVACVLAAVWVTGYGCHLRLWAIVHVISINPSMTENRNLHQKNFKLPPWAWISIAYLMSKSQRELHRQYLNFIHIDIQSFFLSLT